MIWTCLQMTTLHINLFKHALALDDVDRAFNAIMELTDKATRSDCVSELGTLLFGWLHAHSL